MKRYLAITAVALLTSSAAMGDQILFGQVAVPTSGNYNVEGNDLVSMLEAGGHTVTNVALNTTTLGDLSGYDQVWVYDLNTGSDMTATQVANYNIISAWYNNLTTGQNLILDGRMISSADLWTSCAKGLGCPGSAMSEEDAWIQNYATQLSLRDGGLVLGTDHNAFQSGINNINAAIGVGAFSGFYATPPFQATVDSASPLFIGSLDNCGYGSPTADFCVNDNSSTGIVATGLQANGQTLTPLAWHGTVSQAADNAAISTTIGSITFGTCGGPGQEPCPVPEPAPLTLIALGLLAMAWRRNAAHGAKSGSAA